MYINKVLEKIIDNKRGQFWSKGKNLTNFNLIN